MMNENLKCECESQGKGPDEGGAWVQLDCVTNNRGIGFCKQYDSVKHL